MSANEDCSELKGGHPPAVKVGSMRITQHKATHEKPLETKKEEPKTEEDNEAEEAPPTITPKPMPMIISGALAKGDKDFPEEAIKAFHEKPAPSHDYRQPKKGPHIIQQPRK